MLSLIVLKIISIVGVTGLVFLSALSPLLLSQWQGKTAFNVILSLANVWHSFFPYFYLFFALF